MCQLCDGTKDVLDLSNAALLKHEGANPQLPELAGVLDENVRILLQSIAHKDEGADLEQLSVSRLAWARTLPSCV